MVIIVLFLCAMSVAHAMNLDESQIRNIFPQLNREQQKDFLQKASHQNPILFEKLIEVFNEDQKKELLTQLALEEFEKEKPKFEYEFDVFKFNKYRKDHYYNVMKKTKTKQIPDNPGALMLLIKHGAQYDSLNYKGKTLLEIAVERYWEPAHIVTLCKQNSHGRENILDFIQTKKNSLKNYKSYAENLVLLEIHDQWHYNENWREFFNHIIKTCNLIEQDFNFIENHLKSTVETNKN